MRFFANGPDIPSSLIEQRNLGNVIFFCGAGISRPVGLPDFKGLTEKLISNLGAEKASNFLEKNEHYDRVFNALISDFGSYEVNLEIHKALKTPRKPDLSFHKTILDLSSNTLGIPQVVTTNFDLLFEAVDRGIKKYIPPNLPNPSLGRPIDGIVYLHGRLTKPDINSKTSYVLSRADFGRAYLAEGWAAKFVKNLRETHTIVLLGYSANDPPMQYLLEGLHTSDLSSYNSPLYAFVSESSEESVEEWHDKGISPISFNPIDTNYSGLWNSLKAWADASTNTDKWNKKIISLSQKSPTQLEAYERGQVAHFISNKVGSELFANSTPAPPAEWLCVFDSSIRYTKKEFHDESNKKIEVDLLDVYGLDNDPPRALTEEGEQSNTPGINFLSWYKDDHSFSERNQLMGWNQNQATHLPARFSCLAHWVSRIINDPITIWWASGWKTLHPSLNWSIQRNLDDPNLSNTARKFWLLYFETQEKRIGNIIDCRWFDLNDTIKKEGWSPYVFRQLEIAAMPYVEFSRYSYGSPHPPKGDWTNTNIYQIIEAKVRVLDIHRDHLNIPDEHLRSVIQIIHNSLRQTANLLEEVDTRWWRTPTLHPTGERGEQFHGKKGLYFVWFKNLVLRLLEIDLKATKTEIQLWNQNDCYFFGKLLIYFSSFPQLSSNRETAVLLLNIEDDVFWDPDIRRELLFTLRARWPEFTHRQKRRIEKRIIDGGLCWENEDAKEYRRRRNSTAASLLRWLEINNCELTEVTTRYLPKLQKSDPRWSDEWAIAADNSLGPRGGIIQTLTDLKGLDKIPVSRIIDEAQKQTKDSHSELVNFRPFEGLVSEHPRKALLAIRLNARKSNYPVNFWRALLSEWPEDTSQRLRWLMAKTIVQLPKNESIELRYYLSDWLKTHLKELAIIDRKAALKIFDSALTPYLDGDPDSTKSTRGNPRIGGVIKRKSEVSINKAINSPIGKLTECLLSLQPKAHKSHPLPKYIQQRLARLFSIKGNAGGHAVCIVASRLGWFDWFYSRWTKSTLVPLFNVDNERSEAAWHGLAYEPNGLSHETLKSLNSDLIDILTGNVEWNLDEHERQTHIRRLVQLSRLKLGNSKIVSFREVRNILTKLDDKERAEALNALHQHDSPIADWKTFIKPFITNAWPRQIRFRSEETSRSFAHLVEKMGDYFPEAVETVLRFLRPVPHLNYLTHRPSKDNESNIFRKFPEASLSLLHALTPTDRSSCPYELPEALEVIAEAKPELRQSPQWIHLKEITKQ